MAFRIPPNALRDARLAAERAEILRLHGLPPRWLAKELLRLVRQARQELPEYLGHPLARDGSWHYDNRLVWSVIPAVARALGEPGLEANEIQDNPYLGRPVLELRHTVGACLKHINFRPPGLEKLQSAAVMADLPAEAITPDMVRPSAWALLSHSFVNGNPVAFAIDHLCPPPAAGDYVPDSDWLTRHMDEVMGYRGWQGERIWRPELSDDKGPHYRPFQPTEPVPVEADDAEETLPAP